MPTTLNKISEQIRRIHYGGSPSDDAEFQIKEIQENVIQVINRLLKVEQLDVHARLKEQIPSHHLITTYEGVDVAPAYDPTLSIVCTEMDGSMTSLQLDVTPLGTDPESYSIDLSGVAFSGITAAEVQAFFNGGTSSCALQFNTEDDGPVTFLISGIEDFVAASDSISFTYTPAVDAQVWLVPDGGGWIVNDSLVWLISPGTDPPESSIPTILLNYVQDTHDILEALTGAETYSMDVASLSLCCINTDEESIYAEATLPASPITLPKGLGVWRVYPPNEPENEFIPVSSQYLGIIGGQVHSNMSSIFSNINAYEWKDNRTIRFNQPASSVGLTVTMQLLTQDISKIGADAVLPIPADMEDTVIEKVLANLANKGPIDRQNDEMDRP